METIYKNKKKTSKNLTDKERLILNSPEYLHKCTKCGEFKPNTEYTVSRTAKGRKFFSACKVCVNKFYTTGIGRSSRIASASRQRKVNKLKYLFNSAKGNAKKKGITFDILKEDINQLWEEQNGLCFYTAKPMIIDVTNVSNNRDIVSLDKIEPKLGYVKGNIVLCRWVVNKIKNDLSIPDLLEILNDINNEYKKSDS